MQNNHLILQICLTHQNNANNIFVKQYHMQTDIAIKNIMDFHKLNKEYVINISDIKKIIEVVTQLENGFEKYIEKHVLELNNMEKSISDSLALLKIISINTLDE
jgi:CTP synthase (UTP-ammonia lyase)